MDNQNTQVAEPNTKKRHRKKLIIGAVIASFLLIGIVFGSTTNFMGRFTGLQPGERSGPPEEDEEDDIDSRLEGREESSGSSSSSNNGPYQLGVSTNGTSSNTNSTAALSLELEMLPITDLSTLSTTDVYVDSFEIDSDLTKFSMTICTTQDDQNDLEVTTMITTADGHSISDSYDYDTIDISGGNCAEREVLITSDLDGNTTYTGKVEISPTTTNPNRYNDSKTIEFTTPMAAAVGHFEGMQIDQFLGGIGMTDDDEVIVSTMETGQMTDLDLSNSVTSSDDIYISEVRINDAQTHIYVTVGTTENDADDLMVGVTLEGNNSEDPKFFYADIAAGSYVELSIDIDDFQDVIMSSGKTYTITATLYPTDDQDEHNTKGGNDEESTTFTIPQTYEIAGAQGSLVNLISTDDGTTKEDSTEKNTLLPDMIDQKMDIDFSTDQAADSEEAASSGKFSAVTVIENIQDMTMGTAGYSPSVDDSATASELGAKYSDVSKSDWYAANIGRITDLGIMQGYPNGSFGASESVTREQLAKIVIDTFEYPLVDGYTVTEWTDVDSSAWYAPYVYSAEYYGIISGYGSTFGTGMKVNRAEALKVVMEASMIADMPSSELYIGSEDTWSNPFTDVRTFDWYYEYVMEAYYGDIITANSTTFRPADSLNRAEIVTIMLNIIDLLSTATI
ncbi:hypothetical protein CO082_04255 [Candidatus Peregrinibacteria bacterium CG_4_9_14_0_8_um_filter_44_15]|nr:MAG: hypothetical protein CO082_04255 [Candidatus Peregrinibacteria bacterium CG_4_9_14_0_8_um_filter_44_15]